MVSRRRLLAMGGAALGGVMAGCSSEPPQAATPPPSVFRGTSFAGTDLVVDLVEDHGVEQLNLIGPDARLFAQASVAVGENKIELEILNIGQGPSFKHYRPGLHELTAVGERVQEAQRIEIRPDLRIVNVRQYRDGVLANELGKLVVEVENIGTGPTWIHSITYRNSPNPRADDSFGNVQGILRLDSPQPPLKAIIGPGKSQEFIGLAFPLLFSSDQSATCEGEYTISVYAESPVYDPIHADIQTTLGGDAVPAGITGEYTCSKVVATLIV